MRAILLICGGVAIGVIVALFVGERGSDESESIAPVVVTHRTRPDRPLTTRRVPIQVVQRDLTPSDPRYNPVALLKESAGQLSPKEIFASEPRDPVGAPVFEARVKDSISSAIEELKLSSKVRSIKTECKTLSCETRVEVSSGDLMSVYDEINGIMLGDMQAPGIAQEGGTGYVTFTNLYSPEFRDEEYRHKFDDEAYRPAVEAAKQRAAPLP